MKKILADWFNQYFSNPEVLILTIVLIVGATVLTAMGDMLAPVIASVVITYLLMSIVKQFQRVGLSHSLAVWLVYLLFMALVLIGLLVLLPLLWKQLINLLQELPNMVSKAQNLLLELPRRYPNYFSPDQITGLITDLKSHIASMGQWALSLSVSSITTFILIIIYLVLVPLLVFFFLKDQAIILAWGQRYLPRERRLIGEVWQEVNEQIGNYIRGKAIEVLIVVVVSFAVFALMGLHYAVLLSVGVGLSVVIPYLGAVIITIPVIVIAFLQWGWSSQFINLMIAYAVIIALDGNLLVPLLFSEAMDLHPVAIIVAVLVFGGIWGFWGIFFAIPLATLVKAVLNLIGTAEASQAKV